MSKRVNVTISDEIKEYFEKASKETGVSQSALMCIAIKEYVDRNKRYEKNIDYIAKR